MEEASIPRRGCAFLVDFCVVFSLAAVLVHLSHGVVAPTEDSAHATGMFIVSAVPWLYFTLLETSRFQASVGKLCLGMKVVGPLDERLTAWKATTRFFALWFPAYLPPPVAYVAVSMVFCYGMFGTGRGFIQDVASGTRVVSV